MYFLQKASVETSLQHLGGYRDTDMYPQLVDGVRYTVGELRAQLRTQPYRLLVLNLVLAAFMAVLYLVARWLPVLAILLATAVFLAVQVANALLFPASLREGMAMKVFIFILLMRGIHAAIRGRGKSGSGFEV